MFSVWFLIKPFVMVILFKAIRRLRPARLPKIAQNVRDTLFFCKQTFNKIYNGDILANRTKRPKIHLVIKFPMRGPRPCCFISFQTKVAFVIPYAEKVTRAL